MKWFNLPQILSGLYKLHEVSHKKILVMHTASLIQPAQYAVFFLWREMQHGTELGPMY